MAADIYSFLHLQQKRVCLKWLSVFLLCYYYFHYYYLLIKQKMLPGMCKLRPECRGTCVEVKFVCWWVISLHCILTLYSSIYEYFLVYVLAGVSKHVLIFTVIIIRLFSFYVRVVFALFTSRGIWIIWIICKCLLQRPLRPGGWIG